MESRRFTHEPGNATSYDIMLTRISDREVMVSLWPNLHCSACAVFRDDHEVDVAYVAEKLRVSEADATAIVDFIAIQRPSAPKPADEEGEPGRWYRFYGHCGPGHQSSWEEYLWLRGEWDNGALEEIWHEMMPKWAVHSDNVGGHETVDELPPKVREEKLRRYNEDIERAALMLKVLGD